MVDVFLERAFEVPLTPETVVEMGAASGGCFDRNRVNWEQSMLAADGRRMVCWFSAPDAESSRIALREAEADLSVFWVGTIHDAPGTGAPAPDTANVLVERSWSEPVELDAVQAIEDAGAWCLEAHDVQFVRTFFAGDHKRMICLYRAPDAESVRLAQRQAGMPVDDVWAFQPVLV